MKLLFLFAFFLLAPVYAHFTSYGDQGIIVTLVTLPDEPPNPGDSTIQVEINDTVANSTANNIDILLEIYENNELDPTVTKKFEHSNGKEEIPYKFKDTNYQFYVLASPSSDYTGRAFEPVEFYYELKVGDSLSIKKDNPKLVLPDLLIGAGILILIFGFVF